MSGPPPAKQRRRANNPARGDWKSTPLRGWQHGETPSPGRRLRQASREAWETWFGSWFAAHWTPVDVPGLRLVIRLYNAVEGGEYSRAAELRLQMDSYGITPKGQQDRRWAPPKDDDADEPEGDTGDPGPYGHLKLVSGE